MKTQEQVKNFSEEKFKRTFGVDRQTFQVMLSELEEQYKIAHKKGGRRPKLTIFDRLCIFFAYYRDYRTFEDIANDYDVATSTVFDVTRLEAVFTNVIIMCEYVIISPLKLMKIHLFHSLCLIVCNH